MIAVKQQEQGYLQITASGTLAEADYELALPEIDSALAKDQTAKRVMIRLLDFHGWDIGALWREMYAALEYRDSFDRVAVIGENEFQDWLTRLSAPFVGAEVQFFDAAHEAAGEAWLLDRN